MTRWRAGTERDDGVRLASHQTAARAEESAIQRLQAPRSGLGALSEESCIRKTANEQSLSQELEEKAARR
jgi:hypothetical protein